MPTSFRMKLRTGRTRKKRLFRRKKVQGEDRISELPDEILVLILSQLTLPEAVRTSVLSKRWRYVWTYISVLNFDGTRKNKNLSSYLSVYRNDLNHMRQSQYVKAVSSVLAQYRGPNLDELRVCYSLKKKYSSHIDEWIEFALSNRVHTIEFHLSNLISSGEFYTLQSGVLGLDKLGFKSLKTLSLNAVNVGDEAIEYFLSNCLVLERLFLHHNDALRNLKVVGQSLTLKHLEVVRCWEIKTIEICDTDLVSFTYVGFNRKMLFKNVPRLVEVSIDPCGYMCDVQDMFCNLSCCFSQLEILQLKVSARRSETLNNIMLPELKNLKQFVLSVYRFWYSDTPLRYLAMIKNWLNLEKFVFQLKLSHKHNKERKATARDVREAERFCHPCLKVMEIEGYCSSCDFELFKQIIENAVKLEKISIAICDHDSDSKSKSEKDYRKLQRSSVEKRLRTQVPPGVELVLKNYDF